MSQSLVSFDDGSDDWRTRRQLDRLQRAYLATDRRVSLHGMDAWATSEEDRQDSEALGDAAGFALEKELTLLHDGLARAGQSAAGVELVARKVELVAGIDNRRLARRFGA